MNSFGQTRARFGFLAVLASTIWSCSAFAATATRSVSPSAYIPTQAVIVTLTLTPDVTTMAYGVEETPPTGWQITNISSGVLASNGVIKFGVFAATQTLEYYNAISTNHPGPVYPVVARTLTYTATPPSNSVGNKTFAGKVSFDGISPNVVIGGVTSIPQQDTTPPLIGAVSASGITSSSATINWTTDEVSDSQVEYGLTTSYGNSTTLVATLVTSHKQGVLSLTANTLYHYRVKSKDAVGNLATSIDYTFTTAAPPNTPPTISNISDTTTNEDTATGAIAFTVGDLETPVANLTLSAASSNTGLVPVANIVFGGSGANRTVTVTPALNQSGTASITVTVADANGGTASDSFILTVTAVNDAPTISNILNQATPMNTQTSAIPFTIADVETAAGSLTLVGASDNPTLVPNASIVFGGSGGNRTVRVTPASNQTGSATISITVSDPQGATATDTFVLTVGGTNNAPTISSIADQTTNEDTNTSYIPFTVADVDTPVDSLTLMAISSDQTLVPNGSIVLAGTGANRTIKMGPALNQFGVTTITVTVGDGSSSASTSFNLTVNSVNDLPTISNIANQTILENAATGALAFDVSDVETPAASLTLSKTSSNTNLVPTANIVFGGSGANRTVTVTPAANQSGSATITVTVADGNGGTASSSFVLAVTAVNQAPTITDITDRTIPGNSNTGAIAFTIFDNETPVANLTLSKLSSNTNLVPTANIVFGGSGANRTVTVTPAANQSGNTTITVTVADGNGGSVSDSFVLTVTAPVNQPPTVSSIADQTTVAGTVVTINFTVGDPDTSLSALTLSADSSNPSLIPVSNIVLGGSGANRTAKLTPISGQTGAATITIRVGDGSYVISQSFVFTVNSVGSGDVAVGETGFSAFKNVFNPLKDPPIKIQYHVKDANSVSLAIYNPQGTAIYQFDNPGASSTEWTGRNKSQSVVASGVYLIRLTSGKDSVIRKLIIVK